MPYYHVLLRFADAPEKDRCVFSDLSEKELRQRFVKPYQRGKSFLSGSEVIEASRIRQTAIILTSDPSSIELPKIQAKSRREIEEFNRTSHNLMLMDPGRGNEPEDITEAGEDVTFTFITGPPGHGDKLAIAREVMDNPVVSLIVGGLILAGLVFWLGWNPEQLRRAR